MFSEHSVNLSFFFTFHSLSLIKVKSQNQTGSQRKEAPMGQIQKVFNRGEKKVLIDADK